MAKNGSHSDQVPPGRRGLTLESLQFPQSTCMKARKGPSYILGLASALCFPTNSARRPVGHIVLKTDAQEDI
ncbi:hypothetical protein BELL_0837g00050 [Botrytis elliptica]|uniref:Uncharacterized protein n=1 Tax=Botrytis elliptica TaxID=278938 RepID=A0A4Z1JA02_9HELO|nr:hypothetical protein BELL_0837g00050 [Botrytis elliptica]